MGPANRAPLNADPTSTLFDSVPAAKQPTTHHPPPWNLIFVSNRHLTLVSFPPPPPPPFSINHSHDIGPHRHHSLRVPCLSHLSTTSRPISTRPKILTIRTPTVHTVVAPTSESLPLTFSEYLRTFCRLQKVTVHRVTVPGSVVVDHGTTAIYLLDHHDIAASPLALSSE